MHLAPQVILKIKFKTCWLLCPQEAFQLQVRFLKAEFYPDVPAEVFLLDVQNFPLRQANYTLNPTVDLIVP